MFSFIVAISILGILCYFGYQIPGVKEWIKTQFGSKNEPPSPPPSPVSPLPPSPVVSVLVPSPFIESPPAPNPM